jgi:CubicO group peptidase (beta-lactamase class C family)
VSKSQRRRLAKGYNDHGRTVPYPADILLGAGALKSTVADLLKYARWELAEENPAVKVTHEPRFILTDNYSVGLNWQMIHAAGYRRIWQEGNLPGFVSMCLIFPELHMAVVFLANEDDPACSHALSLMVNQIAKTLDPRSSPLNP